MKAYRCKGKRERWYTDAYINSRFMVHQVGVCIMVQREGRPEEQFPKGSVGTVL